VIPAATARIKPSPFEEPTRELALPKKVSWQGQPVKLKTALSPRPERARRAEKSALGRL
jgi:hypothetical protein